MKQITKADCIPKTNAKLFQTKMFRENVDKVKLCLKHDWPMLMVGHAGTGKNESIYQACLELNMPVIRIGCSGDARSSTLLGRINIGMDGKPYWQRGPLTMGVEDGYVVILDELNALDADVAMPIHGLLDERKMTIANNSQFIEADAGFRFIGTMNPISYFGTKSLNQAFNDRFLVHETDFDLEVDQLYLDGMDMSAGTKRALTVIISKIREEFNKGEISQNWGLRTTSNLARFSKEMPLTEAIDCAYSNKLPSGEVAVLKTIFSDFLTNLKAPGK